MRSSSPFAQWVVMQLAAETGIKVLLDGQGADEAIGGYSYFVGAHLFDLFKSFRWRRLRHEASACAENRSVSPGREFARAAYHHMPSMLRRFARRHSRISSSLISEKYRSYIAETQPPTSGTQSFSDFCVNAISSNLPELLRYEDRNSMAFSIESRVPFLDHKLVEFVLSLPSHYKLHNGWSKYVQRKASQGKMPEEIVWRRDKLGFATPQHYWKETLIKPLSDIIRASITPELFDRAHVLNVVNRNINSPIHLSEFWQLVFLLKWIEVFR